MPNPHAITDPAERTNFRLGDPPHPGAWIRHNVLQPFSLNVAETARLISMHRPTLHNVLEGRHAVSPDLAYKLEALTGVDAELLLAMQAGYERAQDREKRGRYAREIARLPAPAGA